MKHLLLHNVQVHLASCCLGCAPDVQLRCLDLAGCALGRRVWQCALAMHPYEAADCRQTHRIKSTSTNANVQVAPNALMILQKTVT